MADGVAIVVRRISNRLAALKARLPALAEACVMAGLLEQSNRERKYSTAVVRPDVSCMDIAERVLAEWEAGS